MSRLMNCRDFELLWLQRLDEIRGGVRPPSPRPAAIPLPSPEADAHAASCPSCRTRAAGYLALAQAIGSLPPVPEPDPALSSRILSSWRNETDRSARLRPLLPLESARPRVSLSWVATAAAVLLTLGSLTLIRNLSSNGGSVELTNAPPPSPLPSPPGKPLPPLRPLKEVLSDAATATLALARETSAPAARIGRDVLGSASEVVGPPGPLVPLLADGPADSIGQPEGETEARSRTWSAPARNAFGFLIPRLPSSFDRQPVPRPDTPGQPG